ncbi:hypothetical protein DE146DRAFT_639179 [Phaeosphaeria sp. MPI-PUGE-AT-0046c]|nr:hypothetical protein DE146DRAFT_639179 [Phaeosphaeria sp. MPI-PUGE-AT-0046c]
MLARWSRVMPGSCRNASCVPSVATIARRRGLHGLWSSDIPTAAISHVVVFTASLSIGARGKSPKSSAWEEAVARLHDAYHRPPPSSPQAPMGQNEEAEWRSTLNNASVDMGGDADSYELDVSLLHASADAWNLLRLDSRLPGLQAPYLPASTGEDIKPYNLPPQSLWAPDVLRLSALRRRQTRKKLVVQAVAIGLLVHDLIRHVDLARFAKRVDPLLDRLSPHIRRIMSESDVGAQKARSIFASDLVQLRSAPVEHSAEHYASICRESARLGLPQYRQDIDGDFHHVSDQLNDGITKLFDQSAKGNDAEKAIVVAKICHNLLVSTSAPTLHTFNVLIAGFVQWRQTALVDDVIAALEPAKIRPNELLCAQVLRYYTNELLPRQFTSFVAKMRGVNDALMLANPTITINEASAGRLELVHSNKVLQKVYPTPMVFEALIDGVLKFAGFDRALDVYYEMKANGWGLTIPALTKLLANCIRHVDWEAGTYIWEEINSIKTKVKPSYVAKAYHHMLSLCSVTGNTVAFNQVLNEVSKRGFDQKAIITAALKTIRWAQHKRHNLAPAWAADNLMIAVSGYTNDTKPSENAIDEPPLDNLDLADISSDQEVSGAKFDGYEFSHPNKGTTIDKQEAWSSWVEHEFGEKPKDPEP